MLKTAQELMGHNDYDVTANVYTHGDDDLKVVAASLQNEYLNNFLKAEKNLQKADLTSEKVQNCT